MRSNAWSEASAKTVLAVYGNARKLAGLTQSRFSGQNKAAQLHKRSEKIALQRAVEVA